MPRSANPQGWIRTQFAIDECLFENFVKSLDRFRQHCGKLSGIGGIELETVEIRVIRAISRGERAGDRATWILVRQAGDGDQHVRCAVLIEHRAPPSATATVYLTIVEQKRITPCPARPNVVDPARTRIVFRPSTLPWIAHFENRVCARARRNRHNQHWSGAALLRLPSEIAPGPLSVENHAKRSDIAFGSNAFALDYNCRDHRIELTVGYRGAVDLVPSEALRVSPRLLPGFFTRISSHVHLDTAHIDVAGRGSWGDSAIPGDLCKSDRQADAEQRKHAQRGQKARKTAAQAPLWQGWRRAVRRENRYHRGKRRAFCPKASGIPSAKG